MKLVYTCILLFSWFVTFTCVPTLLSQPSWAMMFLGVLQASVSVMFTLIYANALLNPTNKETTTNE